MGVFDDTREEIEEMKKELNEVKEESLAMELLKDYKRANKRMFIILAMVIIFLFLSIGCLIYVLNDIGIVEDNTEITQENTDGANNYIGNNGDITNGKADY